MLWIAAVILAVFVMLCWRGRKSHLIDGIPGPKALPIVGNFFDDFANRNDILQRITNREKRFPGIYRIWTGPIPVVFASTPEVFEKVLGSSRHLSKGFYYKFLRPWLGSGLLTGDGLQWFKHRKLLTPTFHHRILNKYIKAFHENSQVLLKKLEEKLGCGQFDIYPYISLCTLDIICDVAMNIKVNAQDNKESPYVAAIFRVLELTKERILKFWLFPDFIYFRTSGGKQYIEQVAVLHDFTGRIISERKAAMATRRESLVPQDDLDVGLTKKPRAFLELLLREAETESIILDEREIVDQVNTFAFEGHDTTAVAICWTLAILSGNSDLQEKTFNEQKDIFGGNMTRPPTMADLNEMKLLERVVKESTRIYPSIPLIARVTDEDITHGEHTIPKGTTVVLNIYNLHRNPNLYPNPDRFDPDRFLPENLHERHPYSHVPFSAGSRNCIGQKFAMLEEKVILSSIIRNYRLKLMRDVKPAIDLLLRSETGIIVTVARRDH